MNTLTKRLAMIVAVSLIISIASVTMTDYAWAQDTSGITRGALIGGAAGLLFGNGLGSTLQGATIGAGVGGITTGGYTGQQARESAGTGALVGAGLGLIFGGGLGGALEGGLYGGAAGSIYGGVTADEYRY